MEQPARRTVIAVLRLTGDLDLAQSPSFRDRVDQTFANPGVEEVVIDVSGVDSLDSAGVGVIVHAHNRAREHGAALRLRGASKAVHRIFVMTGLDAVLNFED